MSAGKNIAEFTKFCGKIVGIGRNYVAHAHELGNKVPESPIIFLKPRSAFISNNEHIQMPFQSHSLHHEIELGVIINKSGFCIPKAECMDYVGGYCLALDMTARDLQDQSKKQGLPWSLAKGFDSSCPVSHFIPITDIPDVNQLNLKLSVHKTEANHAQEPKILSTEVRQNDSCSLMIYDIESLIHFISHYYTLEFGDLILTGTPAGVSQVGPGDILQSEMYTDESTSGSGAGAGIQVSMKNMVVEHPYSDGSFA